jgi:hypothetical protein
MQSAAAAFPPSDRRRDDRNDASPPTQAGRCRPLSHVSLATRSSQKYPLYLHPLSNKGLRNPGVFACARGPHGRPRVPRARQDLPRTSATLILRSYRCSHGIFCRTARILIPALLPAWMHRENSQPMSDTSGVSGVPAHCGQGSGAPQLRMVKEDK